MLLLCLCMGMGMRAREHAPVRKAACSVVRVGIGKMNKPEQKTKERELVVDGKQQQRTSEPNAKKPHAPQSTTTTKQTGCQGQSSKGRDNMPQYRGLLS